MLFHPLTLLVSFLVFCGVYFSLPKRFQTFSLLVASCAFYAFFSIPYTALLLALSLATFALARGMENAAQCRRSLLVFSLLINLATLVAFRYFIFPDANVAARALLHWNYVTGPFSFLWSVGLSFAVFQNVSYAIEVYRRTIPAETGFVAYASYVMFFPKLLSGPIVRPKIFLPQLEHEHRFDSRRMRDGLERILWGAFKKIVIADNIAVLTAYVYAHLASVDGPALFLLAVLYPFQIYADFSGYADIAIGGALILGFHVSENFNRPFAARSFTEFWQRWHMSLSNFLRDYLYFPIAYANGKKTALRRYFGFAATFLISGIWHGALWTYFAFGLFNGATRILNTLSSHVLRHVWNITDKFSSRLTVVIQIIATFTLVAITHVLFSAPTIGDAWYVLSHMLPGLRFLVDPSYVNVSVIGMGACTLALVIVAIIVMEIVQYLSASGRTLEQYSLSFRIGAYCSLALAIAWFGAPALQPFIYFRF